MNTYLTQRKSDRMKLLAVLLFAVFFMGLAASQTADYGDAPDTAGLHQFGPASGHYPTLNPTGNTVFPGRTGPYHLNPFEENLGPRVDTEGSARVVNVDWFDDGFKHFFFLLVQVPVPTYVTVEVTVPGGAPPGTRYINMAVDFDQDGKWCQYLDPLGQPVDEWVVRNYIVNVPGDITAGVTQPLVLLVAKR